MMKPLPPHAALYLEERGITKEIQQRYSLSWEDDVFAFDHSGAIAIPIPLTPSSGLMRPALVKYRRDPRDPRLPKYAATKGLTARLYPHHDPIPPTIIITEGELDALRLLSLGLAATSSTAGAMSWKDEWSPLFAKSTVYVWYDADAPGGKGAHRTASSLAAHAKRVTIIRHDPSLGKDVTDVLKKYSSLANLEDLPLSFHPVARRPPVPDYMAPSFHRDTPALARVLSRYNIPIPQKARAVIACCFHDDRNPSLSINMEKNLFNCFACGAKGSAYDFLMQKENIDFKEAKKLYETL